MKTVTFNDRLDVKYLRVWNFATRQYRKSGSMWEMSARDRDRFQRRIRDLECVLNPVIEQKIQYQQKFNVDNSELEENTKPLNQ